MSLYVGYVVDATKEQVTEAHDEIETAIERARELYQTMQPQPRYVMVLDAPPTHDFDGDVLWMIDRAGEFDFR